MRYVREVCGATWHRLNSIEPGIGYLVRFFSTSMALFAIAFLIGHA